VKPAASTAARVSRLAPIGGPSSLLLSPAVLRWANRVVSEVVEVRQEVRQHGVVRNQN
jgi:hypothetical protein